MPYTPTQPHISSTQSLSSANTSSGSSHQARASYLYGFNNEHQSEALEGALPIGQNSPQRPKYGLYPEQINGTAFTLPRAKNKRSWQYRIRPSVVQGSYKRCAGGAWERVKPAEAVPPTQLRWNPLPRPTREHPTKWRESLKPVALNGSTHGMRGGVILLFACNVDDGNEFFYNADAEMMFVGQSGYAWVHTEFGDLELFPGGIVVVPRGIKFQITRHEGCDAVMGYLIENLGSPFQLPDLGPIGANGLAAARDFAFPKARYYDQSGDYQVICKFQDNFWQYDIQHHPLDVVAWHGNFLPYSYDLNRFNTLGSISFDHPDPSIFTVLTSQTDQPGVANIDFVIFPERWLVANHSFRPPYYHRNIMSEYMGLIKGVYDAKPEGFQPGGGSLHNCMSAHGPDGDTFYTASQKPLEPEYLGDTLAFMFESSQVWQPTLWALDTELLQRDYLNVWQNLKSQFDPHT